VWSIRPKSPAHLFPTFAHEPDRLARASERALGDALHQAISTVRYGRVATHDTLPRVLARCDVRPADWTAVGRLPPDTRTRSSGPGTRICWRTPRTSVVSPMEGAVLCRGIARRIDSWRGVEMAKLRMDAASTYSCLAARARQVLAMGMQIAEPPAPSPPGLLRSTAFISLGSTNWSVSGSTPWARDVLSGRV